MLKQVIFWLFAFIVVVFVILWVVSGGPKRIFTDVKNFAVSSATSTEEMRLPWQPDNLFPTIEIDHAIEEYAQGLPHDSVEAIQRDVRTVETGLTDAMNFGNPSPLRGAVSIVPFDSSPTTENTGEEYIRIEASSSNSAPVSLYGWSLQSAVSGVRVSIPEGAIRFNAGTVNNLSAIALEPGASAYINSGPSPVGASFRENVCSGYLGQFQSFAPTLPAVCPGSDTLLPVTPENISLYGDACIDYTRSLPSCFFPSTLPDHLSPPCRNFLQQAFSYNGCIARNGYGEEGAWRIFLGSSRELWRNSHDVIRLLDAQGQTVDAYTY